MKKILLILLLSSLCYAAQTKILFIGNSLTFFNDMPTMFASICESANKDVLVETRVRAGTSLRFFSSDDITFERIRSDQWDYVILQSDDITAFEDLHQIEINALGRLKNVITSNCSTTKIIYEMIWGFKDGVDVPGEQFYSYEEYINKIYSGTLSISDRLNLITAPVGWSWKEALADAPNTELFWDDDVHPALRGSYLAACVFYSIIFRESVENNGYHSTLADNEASFLQRIASEVVMDNASLWYPDITGIEKQYNIPEDYILLNNYPNPFNPSTTITYTVGDAYFASPTNVILKVFDILGNKVATLVNDQQLPGQHSVTWNASHLPSGVYICVLNVGNRTYTRKLNLLK